MENKDIKPVFFLKTQTILFKFHMWDGAGTDPGFGKGDQGSRYV